MATTGQTELMSNLTRGQHLIVQGPIITIILATITLTVVALQVGIVSDLQASPIPAAIVIENQS